MASAFRGFDLVTLTGLRDKYLAAVEALATASSYTMTVVAANGVNSQRTLNRVNLESIKATLAEIMEEIRRLEDNRESRTGYSNFAFFGQ